MSEADPCRAGLAAEGPRFRRTRGEKAFAEAGDLDALKPAQLAHAGDRSPLALANREIGALPPAGQGRRRQAGRPGPARRHEALAARQAELEAERDARVLVEEAVDVTLPWDRRAAGARHPLTTLQERIADLFVGMGYEVAEGPEVEAEWFNFDALNFAAGPPGPLDAGHLLRRPRRRRAWCCAPTPRRCRSARMLTPRAADLRRSARAGSTAPTSSTRRTRPVFNQVEGLVVDEGITMAHLRGHPRPLRRGDVRRRAS